MRLLISLSAAALLAACATSEERAARQAEKDAEIAAQVAARQGEEVRQICFTSNINGWRALGDDAVLLRKSVSDWYKLDLSGTCDPEWAFNAIALESRGGSSCLSRGDQIHTFDSSTIPGSCFISRIYKWDEDAPLEDDATAEAGAGSSGG